MAVNFLLQADTRAWRLLEEAASDDDTLRGLLEYRRGKQHWERAEISPAWKWLQEAVRLDPTNEYALILLEKIAWLTLR